jgi:hypothetical protein
MLMIGVGTALAFRASPFNPARQSLPFSRSIPCCIGVRVIAKRKLFDLSRMSLPQHPLLRQVAVCVCVGARCCVCVCVCVCVCPADAAKALRVHLLIAQRH